MRIPIDSPINDCSALCARQKLVILEGKRRGQRLNFALTCQVGKQNRVDLVDIGCSLANIFVGLRVVITLGKIDEIQCYLLSFFGGPELFRNVPNEPLIIRDEGIKHDLQAPALLRLHSPFGRFLDASNEF